MTKRFPLTVLVVVLLGAAPLAQQPPPVNPPAPSFPGQPPPVNPPAPGAKPAPPAEAVPMALPVPTQQRNQPINVKVEVTITEQRGKSSPTRKLLSVLAADGFRNSIRSQETFFPPMEVPLNVDVTPTILTGSRGESTGKIRLMLNLEYDLPGAAGGSEPKKTSTGDYERITMKSAVRENLIMIVDDGKPLVVAQSADPVSDRQVTVEVRATILK